MGERLQNGPASGDGAVFVPPVQRGPLEQVSASQVITYRNCPRQWYNSRALGIRTPSSRSQLLGTGCHKQIEERLLQDRPFHDVEMPEGDPNREPVKIFARMLEPVEPHLPPPAHRRTRDVLVEQPFKMATYAGGPTMLGFVDLAESFRPLVRATDWKTTSDFRYAKTPKELSEDTQLVVYATWLFRVTSDPRLEIMHGYIRTRGAPKFLPVVAEVGQGEILDRYGDVVRDVREMVSWWERAPATAEALPPRGTETGACKKFDGCPYLALCGFPRQREIAPAAFEFRVQNREESEMSEENKAANSLVERLRKQGLQNGAATAAGDKSNVVSLPAAAPAASSTPAPLPAAAPAASSTPVPAPAPAAAPTPASGDVPFTCERCGFTAAFASAEAGRLIAQHYIRACQSAAAPAPAPASAAPAASTPAPAVSTLPDQSGILPPDHPPRTTTDAEAAALQAQAGKRKRKSPASGAADAAPAAATAAPAPDTATAAPSPDTATAAPAPATAAATSAPATAAATPAPAPVTDEGSMILCVNTAPTKLPPGISVTYLEELLEREGILRACAEVAQVSDIRSLNYKAKDYVSMALRAWVKDHPAPACLVVHERSFGAAEALEVFIPRARFIFGR